MGKKRSNENKIDINDLKFYYGIPHAHCDFSTGRGTPIDAFDYARRNNLDFLILTDHNNHLDKKIKLKGNEISK